MDIRREGKTFRILGRVEMQREKMRERAGERAQSLEKRLKARKGSKIAR